MQCRIGCGACCIAPSITSPIPGMPEGKPAGVRCIQLTDQNYCKLFGKPERPTVCSTFKALADVCGTENEHAYQLLTQLEIKTMV